jgi:hypothetical protein
MAFDREIAALTVFCEASSATPAERRNVMQVILNRLRDPKRRFGITIADICLARYQFSEWNDDKINNVNLRRGARARQDDPAIVDCLKAYDEVMAGLADPTHNACHYIDKTIDLPTWAKQAAISLETDHFLFFIGVA